MRRAIVIAAHYPKESGFPNDPHWIADAELLTARLAQHGYAARRLSQEHELDELREEMRELPLDDPTVIYFVGYLVMTKTGEPALLVGGNAAQPLGLRALVHRFAAQVQKGLLIVDARSGSVVQSAIAVGDDVLLERALESADEPNIDVVIRVQPWVNEGESPAILHDILGQLARTGKPIETSDVAAALSGADRRIRTLYRAADDPFVLLPARDPAPMTATLSVAPTISIRGPRTARPTSAESTEPARAVDPSRRDTIPNRPSRPTPPPKPSSPPPKPSTPPPKPSSDSKRPPPKPKAEESAGVSIPPIRDRVVIQPMMIRVVNAEPPSKPDLEPPPESWGQSHEPPPKPETAPKTEEALFAALDELLGDAFEEARLQLLERFLERNPHSKAALQRLTEALVEGQMWERLGAQYERLLPEQTDPEAVAQLCVLQARLCCNQLALPDRALPWIERATELFPKRVDLQLEAAAIYEQLEQAGAAKGHYLAALGSAPLDTDVHHRLTSFFGYRGDADRAFQSAAILASLDAATPEEMALYGRHEKGTLPRPTRPLNAEDWMLGLEPGAKDPAFTNLLELVSDSALGWFKPNRHRVIALRERLQLEEISTSTTMLARSLAWTAQFFAIPAPALYLDSGAAPPAPVPILDPAWSVGREYGKGTSQAELVFHWTRSITRNTGTARVLRLFPDDESLDTLLVACFVAARCPAPNASPEALDLALALRQTMGGEGLQALTARMTEATFEQWRERLQQFLERVALCSNRAGLVATADPKIAARCLAELDFTEAQLEHQIEDLYRYACSDEYAELRKRLGLRIT